MKNPGNGFRNLTGANQRSRAHRRGARESNKATRVELCRARKLLLNLPLDDGGRTVYLDVMAAVIAECNAWGSRSTYCGAPIPCDNLLSSRPMVHTLTPAYLGYLRVKNVLSSAAECDKKLLFERNLRNVGSLAKILVGGEGAS
jgi:hypothetical protein